MLLFRLFISRGDQSKFYETSLSDHFGMLCFAMLPFGFFICFCFRLDELRHRLVPLYNYDPNEEQDLWDAGNKDEEEELTVSEPLKIY